MFRRSSSNLTDPPRLACALLLFLLCAARHHSRAATLDEAARLDTNRIMTIDLKIAPGDWNTLRYQHREAEFFPEEGQAAPTNAYSWFAAEATLDGTRVERVQVRKKGYIGSNDIRRPALKLRLPRESAAGGGREAIELTLNNNLQDPSFVRQSLAYEVFRRAGVPAPRCSLARVTVNGKDLGIYSRIEPVNALFLREHFGSASGNLYEGGRSDFRPNWMQNFDVKSSKKDRSDLEEVTRAVAQTTGSLLPVLDKYFGIEGFMRFWAAECLINQVDGYAANMNNFYLYHDPRTGRFAFIPWGTDSTFFSGRPLNSVRGDPKSVIGVSILANRVYNSEDGASRYRSALRQLLDTAWNEKLLLREVDRLETLLAGSLHPEPDDLKHNINAVRHFITGRRAELMAELDGPAPVLKSKPLELAKRRNVGRIAGHFVTTSPGANGDQPASGKTELSGTLWDKDLHIEQVSLSANLNSGPDSTVFISLIAAAPDGAQYFIYLGIDPDSYAAGTSIPIDNTHVFGMFTARGSKDSSPKRIGMLRGSLSFTKAGKTPGSEIAGEFKADIFSKLPNPSSP